MTERTDRLLAWMLFAAGALGVLAAMLCTAIGSAVLLGRGALGDLVGSSLVFVEVLVLVTHRPLRRWLDTALGGRREVFGEWIEENGPPGSDGL